MRHITLRHFHHAGNFLKTFKQRFSQFSQFSKFQTLVLTHCSSKTRLIFLILFILINSRTQHFTQDQFCVTWFEYSRTAKPIT